MNSKVISLTNQTCDLLSERNKTILWNSFLIKLQFHYSQNTQSIDFEQMYHEISKTKTDLFFNLFHLLSYSNALNIVLYVKKILM